MAHLYQNTHLLYRTIVSLWEMLKYKRCFYDDFPSLLIHSVVDLSCIDINAPGLVILFDLVNLHYIVLIVLFSTATPRPPCLWKHLVTA